MKNNLAKLLAVSSLVAGGSILAATPANAIRITLDDGDFININSYGALFEGEEVDLTPFGGGIENSDGAVITKVSFDDNNSGLIEDFIAPPGFARADLVSTNIEEFSAYTTTIGVAQIRSLDLNDTSIFTPRPGASGDFDFGDGGVSNTFDAVGDVPFITLNDPAIGGDFDPDLTLLLRSFTTTQDSSLLQTQARIGVGFEGIVDFVTSEGEVMGTGSFSTTIPANGVPSSQGTGVVSAEVEAVPESSTVGALIGFGLLGSALAFKKKSKVA